MLAPRSLWAIRRFQTLRTSLAIVVVLVVTLASPSRAFAWVNDANGNRIDDRIERVHSIGIAAAHRNDDPGDQLAFGVVAGNPLRYPVRIRYQSFPAASDQAALSLAGVPWTHAYASIPYLRTEASYAQIQAISLLPGVTRIEVIPVMVPSNHIATRLLRARDSRGYVKAQNDVLFPSARGDLGLDGRGVVIAIFDTGVNDDTDIATSYPGHESLKGKFLGGGQFYFGNPILNTQPGQSLNPQDHGAAASEYHATHVAGIAMGTGGPSGALAGVAPAARLVDCKVLSDAGASVSGVPEAVDWCLYNRHTLWPGLTGADTAYRGVDVINMSLGDVLSSDGTEADAIAVNAAVRGGITVVCASGNLGLTDWIASPSSADSSICVGATSHSKTLDRGDDAVTSFAQEGPRADDGDGDHLDEMKPNVVAPGEGIFSANGDPTTDGTGYKALSGTSMASPMVAGGAALVLQANPALRPLEVRAILQNTADHNTPSTKGDRPNDPFVLDPNYDPGCGWGLVDLYAAAKEALNSASGVQVTQMRRPFARVVDGEVDLGWVTQREYPFLGFEVQRAVDAGGGPGAFTRINPTLVPPSPAGDPVLQGDDNRIAYAYTDDDPALTPGTTYWYRVAWVDLASVAHVEPALPVVFESFPRVATAYYSITHDAPDSDLGIRVGVTHSYDPSAADFAILGPGAAAQDSFQISGIDFFYVPPGHLRHFWSVPFTTVDGIGGILPPSHAFAWFLEVTEGGFADQLGRIESFSMFVNDAPGSASGTTYTSDSPTPHPTVDGTTATLWIPEPGTVAVEQANLAARSVADGVRLELRLASFAEGATAQVFRSDSDQFATRRALAEAEALTSAGFAYVDRTAEPGRTYSYWVVVASPDGDALVSGPVAGARAQGWTRSEILGAQPNPMTRGGELRFRIGTEGAAAGSRAVSLELLDLQGRLVRRFELGAQPAGGHGIRWDGLDRDGRPAPAALYFLRLRIGAELRTSRFALVR